MIKAAMRTGMVALWCAGALWAIPASAQTLSLETAVEAALRHHVEIQKAEQQIRRQEGVYVETRGHVLPQIGIDAAYQHRAESLLPEFDGTVFGNPDNWNTGVFVRQVLYGGGRAVAVGRRLEALNEVVRAQLAAAVNRAVYDVQDAYISAHQAQRDVTVRQAEVALLEQQLADTRQKFRAGTVSEFDVLQVQVELANARVPLVRAESAVTVQRTRLIERIGDHSLAVTALAPVQVETQVDLPLEEALARAQKQRPEIALTHHQQQAAEQSLKAGRSGFLPQMQAEGRYAIEKDNFSDDFGDNLRGWQVGVQGSWILFDGLSSRGVLEQGRADLNIAELEQHNQSFTIALDVKAAHAAWREARTRYDATQQVATQAETGLRLARSRYSNGAAPQIEVLRSQVALTQARINALTAEHDVVRTLADLRRAMGDYGRYLVGE